MLVNLHVKNLAIIDEIEIDFMKHLNILTGETGAGKSIIIGSVNIALGSKVPSGMIRKGADYGLVELVFQTKNQEALQMLRKLEISVEDEQIIISRKLMKGRSVCKVNGEAVPISFVRELSGHLIDIHGQHEHQSLLYKKKHLEILDYYARDELYDLRKKTKRLYHEYKNILNELNKSDLPQEERTREISFLKYEMNEIEAAVFKEGEEEELDEAYKKMSNSNRIMEGFSDICQLLSESPNSILQQTDRALKNIKRLEHLDLEISGFSKQMENIDSLIGDLNMELKNYMEEMEYDEDALRQMEERLELIDRMKAKYGNTLDKIMEYYEKSEVRLNKLLQYEQYQNELKEKLADMENRLKESCRAMSVVRNKYASRLSKEIFNALVELNFLDVRFEVVFHTFDHYTENGNDDIEFFISTNPGEDLKPLGKVASGGELSRVMLAIKSILADNDTTDTLIFDEIDVGVSGRTAQKVSERLSYIAKKHQVICITHLPQIAAMADAHFVIEKGVNEDKTVTSIRKLELKESVKELARILGGAIITDTVIKSAKEMKQLAARTKNY